MENKVKVK